MQSQRTSQKRAVKKIRFFNCKMCLFFFHFSSFCPLLLSNLITFLFLIHFKNLNFYRIITWNFTNHFWNSNSNRALYKEFFECSKTGLYNVWWFVFFEFLTLSTLGGHNFLNSIVLFLTIFNKPNASIKEIQVLFGHQKQPSLLLGFGLPWMLKCLVTDWFTLVGEVMFLIFLKNKIKF
jgi:hypothetical protein